MTEKQVLLAMLTRAGIGHGMRTDWNPAGESVQVENDADDERLMITEFAFDEAGALKSVHCYEHQEG